MTNVYKNTLLDLDRVYCPNCDARYIVSPIIPGVQYQIICSKCRKSREEILEGGRGVMDKTTTYIYDNDHDYYECSSCGLVWALGNEFSLQENQMYYCPKCGRRIVEAEGVGVNER